MHERIVRKMYPMYMVFPALLFFCVFYSASIIGGFVFSLTDWNIALNNIKFIGFENFKTLAGEQQFREALANTFVFNFVSAFFKIGFGLILSLVLNIEFKGRNFFRALFYMPCILSTLVVGYIFTFVYQSDGGLINTVLHGIRLDALAVDWLGDMKIALFAVTAVEVWMWTGYDSTIFLAGLQSIPKELEEAAKIDGANRWNVFRHIKWPFLRASFSVIVTINLIGGFKVFDLVVSLTNGGPIYATEVMSSFMYKVQAQGTLGYASAIGLVQFLIITAVTLPILLFLRRKEIEA